VIIGSFAADHVITSNTAFAAAVREAVAVAATDRIVTIGIEPTEPSVGFGYIKIGGELSVDRAPSARGVDRFVEKPKLDLAKQYVASGEYLWNAGMFIAPASLILEILADTEPDLHSQILTLAKAIVDGTDAGSDSVADSGAQAMAKIWPTLKKIAIDYSVAEPAAEAGRVAVVPASFGWHDVGDFAAIAELQSAGHKGGLSVLGEANVVSDSSSGILVSETNRLIALIGLEDVIVVDTEDALLITTKAHAQQVKNMVDKLKSTGHGDVL
jgi:mannose-1-phosphate guanylyltransferase